MTVVGVALAGGAEGDEAAVPNSGSSVVVAPSTDVPSRNPARADVVVTSPARANQVITTSDLVVRGHVRESSWRVQVVLQSHSAEPIVVRTGGPMTRPGDRDRSPGRTFIITLPLPDPRPSGPAVVQVVAYNASGRAQDVVLRPIQIGALVDPTFRGTGERSPSGEDGLMGGIPFGTNVAPRDVTGPIARCHLPDAIRVERRLELAGSGC